MPGSSTPAVIWHWYMSVAASGQLGPEVWVVLTSTHPPTAGSSGRQEGRCVGGRWSWAARERRGHWEMSKLERQRRIGGDKQGDEAARLSVFWLQPFPLIAPITKRVRQKVKAALFWEFSISPKPVFSIVFDLSPTAETILFFVFVFCSLWWMLVYGMGRSCSTPSADVLHWSVSNLVLASWQNWLPSGINYATVWFISVGSSTQHSTLSNPIGTTSVAQPLQLSPNQIYWVCVASVSPLLTIP